MLSITLKTHNSDNKQNISINSIPFGSSIQTALDNFNQNRTASSRILKLFNPYGQEIPQTMWKIQVKENMVFFIDQPID
jgi:hypothetical protein